MSTQEKIRLDVSNLPSFLPGYDEDSFVSTMSREEIDCILVKSGELYDSGREEEAERLDRTIPVDPEEAVTQLVLVGKKGLLSMGLNLADAERAYGSDWLERFEVGDGYLRLTED